MLLGVIVNYWVGHEQIGNENYFNSAEISPQPFPANEKEDCETSLPF
jgi:hypothetical protein